MSCGITPSQFCPNFQNCDANFMNFMFVLCLYYYVFSPFNPYKLFANLPLIITLIPPFVISLFIYILYLFASPLEDLISILFPSLAVYSIPISFIFLVGLIKTKTLEVTFRTFK